jgi:hypothetical protein
MKKPLGKLGGRAALLAMLLALGWGGMELWAREHQPTLPPGPTPDLFELLNNSYNGKLSDFYVLADTYPDPNNAEQKLTHVLSVDYDKTRVFGKLTIHVRVVDKLQPQQLKTYTPEQIFDFGQYDAEKFVKTGDGGLGQPGDMFLQAKGDMPLASAPITDKVREEYDTFLTQYLIPALKKK